MKKDIMRNQLPNPIRFIINYISPWCEDKVAKLSCTSLYQNYLEWCGENGEKPFTNNTLGQKFSDIHIDQIRSRDNEVRVYFYIIDRSKIVTRLRELGLGDMEEFSDIAQDDLPENKTTDIPIFNVPEIIPPKIIPLQSVNNSSLPSKDKKNDSTQDLFDYVAEDTHAPVAFTFGTSKTSKPPESVVDKPKPVTEVSSAILLARQQREERLRKRAVELEEDPDVFVTITEKDRLNSIAFQDRMKTDARMCSYAEELEEDPKEHMDMKVRERLIGEEIIRRSLEEDGITFSWLDTDEK